MANENEKHLTKSAINYLISKQALLVNLHLCIENEISNNYYSQQLFAIVFSGKNCFELPPYTGNNNVRYIAMLDK